MKLFLIIVLSLLPILVGATSSDLTLADCLDGKIIPAEVIFNNKVTGFIDVHIVIEDQTNKGSFIGYLVEGHKPVSFTLEFAFTGWTYVSELP